jgi:hypothetical protein
MVALEAKREKKILSRIRNEKIKFFFFFKNPIFYRLKYRFFLKIWAGDVGMFEFCGQKN